MSVARRLLLAASTNAWLRDHATRRRFVLRSVSRFMPGERMEDAMAAAQRQHELGIGAILTHLGENLTTRDEADAVMRHYLDLLDRLRGTGLDTQISIKPTQLGLELDAQLCADHLQVLVERADAAGAFVWIDMERAAQVDATLALLRRMRALTPRIGVALQAYLHRTARDLDELLPLGVALRLVKGAYLESAEVAYPRKADVDENYYELAVRALAGHRRPGALLHLATHDSRLVQRLETHIEAERIPRAAYEYAMLYGIGEPLQRRLVAAGQPLRVLISYGAHWFPWYMRRLAERPANVWFVLQQVFR